MSTIKPAIVILSETKDRITTVEILHFVQNDRVSTLYRWHDNKVFFREHFAGILTEDENGYTFVYNLDYLCQKDAKAVSLTLPLTENFYCTTFAHPICWRRALLYHQTYWPHEKWRKAANGRHRRTCAHITGEKIQLESPRFWNRLPKFRIGTQGCWAYICEISKNNPCMGFVDR